MEFGFKRTSAVRSLVSRPTTSADGRRWSDRRRSTRRRLNLGELRRFVGGRQSRRGSVKDEGERGKATIAIAGR